MTLYKFESTSIHCLMMSSLTITTVCHRETVCHVADTLLVVYVNKTVIIDFSLSECNNDLRTLRARVY